MEAKVSPEFHALSEILRKRGGRALFMQYYLGLAPNIRMRYKRIRGVFMEGGSLPSILLDIKKDERKEDEDEKGILKKVGRIMKKIVGTKED